jgi:hypothetical protein
VARPSDPKDQEDGSRAVPKEDRRDNGYAVAGLNALSALGPGAHPEWGSASRDDAIGTLAAAGREQRLGVPRVLVLDALVKLAHRRPAEIAAAGSALDDLLLALVQDAGVPVEHQTDAVGTVKRALDSVARRRVLAPTRHPWKRFATDVQRALGLTAAEVDKPLCNDRQVVDKAGVKAIGVTVDFHTDVPPAQMTVCDPTRWHECTAAFHEMQPWADARAVNETRPNGWRRDLLETVDFLPEVTLETPLRFTYSSDDAPDPAWIHLDYVLIEATGDIAVDEGSIDVRRARAGKHAGRTRVSTKKLIFFKNEMLASWPTVACDTFWADLVVNAAVGCLGGGAQEPDLNGNGGTAFMPDQKEQLSAAIDEAAEAARESIGVYTELAKQAASQLSGASPADNAAWLQLATKAYGRAFSDAAKSWTIYSEMLNVLADPPDPPSDV